MTKDQWDRVGRIDKKFQEMWDEFPPDVKSIILEPRPPQRPNDSHGLPPNTKNYLMSSSSWRHDTMIGHIH